MTLIFNAHTAGSANDTLTLVSDILLTTDEPTSIPILLPHMPRPAVVELEKSFPVGTGQKTVTFGKSVLQYAGRIDCCHQVLRAFCELSNCGNDEANLSEAIAMCDFSPEKLEKFGVTTFFLRDRHNIVSCGHNFDKANLTNENIQYTFEIAGSGKDDFLVDIPDITENLESVFRLGSIYSMARVMAEPFFANNNALSKRYGSWFEFTSVDNDGFSKEPIALQIWTKSDDERFCRHRQLVFSQYIDHTLIISSFLTDPNMGSGINFMVLNDPLERGQRLSIEGPKDYSSKVNFDPFLVLNVLLNLDTGSVSIHPLMRGPEASTGSSGIELIRQDDRVVGLSYSEEIQEFMASVSNS